MPLITHYVEPLTPIYSWNSTLLVAVAGVSTHQRDLADLRPHGTDWRSTLTSSWTTKTRTIRRMR